MMFIIRCDLDKMYVFVKTSLTMIHKKHSYLYLRVTMANVDLILQFLSRFNCK